jgi:SAM-dependent methyltransferase
VHGGAATGSARHRRRHCGTTDLRPSRAPDTLNVALSLRLGTANRESLRHDVEVVHEAAATGFSRDAERYHRSRPTYHPGVARRVVDRYGHGVMVELGAGTGIFTRQLVDLGQAVIAVEPVVTMRTLLTDSVPEADVRIGSAESIPLDDEGANTVVASQSFHWFDYRPALDEIHRVLRPGGHLVTVWNVRDENVDWVAACAEVLERYAGPTPRYRDMAWRRAINSDARFGSVDEWRIANPFPTTPDGVVDRALSTSFIAALTRDKQETVAEQIRAIVTPLGEAFDYPYVSQLQAWRRIIEDDSSNGTS